MRCDLRQISLLALCLLALFWPCQVRDARAGSLDSPAAPTDAGSAMYKLEDVYKRLDDGTVGSKRSGAFQDPSAAPGATGHNIDETMAKAPVKDDTNGAVPVEVRSGKTFYGLNSSAWGLCTGTMTDKSLSADSTTLAAGYYLATTLDAVDTDLIAANICGGVTLFGIAGDSNVANTSSGDATAPEIVAGKIAWVDGVAIIGTAVAKSSFSGAEGSLSFAIPDGIYSGSQTATAVDADLLASNIASGVNLFGTAGTAGGVPSGNAVEADVLSGKTFSNASTASLTGTMPNNGAVTVTPSTSSQTIAAGYHNGSGYAEGDADLVTTNIKSGKDIFGVSGDSNVVDTSSGDATASDVALGAVAFVDGAQVTGNENLCAVPARVAKTGQTKSYADGDDGYLGTGAGKVNPRFTDNIDGTVTDNLTGLIWLKNANCFGTQTWANALTAANSLSSGSCGLSDGSTVGMWRLPSRSELLTLIDHGFSSPALPNTAGTKKWTSGDPFTGVQSTNYWSASTYEASLHSYAWFVSLNGGNVSANGKTNTSDVWPVRGGQ